MMTASEYLWWPFMNRQIIETCEKCRECTLFGKNHKPASTYNTAESLPVLSGPNQELQLDFAGPIIDEKGSKIFLLVAIDRFSKFPSVLISKTTGAKNVTKFLDSYIRVHGLPRSIRTDHGSGFNNHLVQEFCSNRGIKHILSPVGDHRGSGLVEQSIQTIKIKLGVAQLDPNFKNIKDTVHQILEDIRKSNHSVFKKSPFELHFGLRHVIMLFNLILQPKDWSATSLHQTRSPVTTTVGTGQKLFLVAVPVQHFQPDSNPCFHWTQIQQTANPTRHWRILLGRLTVGHSTSGIFPQMEGN